MARKTKKKSEKIDYEKERRKDKNTIIAISIIAAIVATLAVASYELNKTQTDSDKVSMIDDIKCDKSQSSNFHMNAHVDVFVGGRLQEIPAEIGIINNTCRYWIYTQDASGIMHIDSPIVKQFTLSQFFDVWKATSSVPPIGTPAIYINGQETSSTLNETVIKPHDEIAIVYGIKPAVMPSLYQFPPSL